MKMPPRGSARRLLVSAVVALAAALGACAPLPSSRDASSSAGGGGGAAARAAWVSETHDAPATLAREDLGVRATPQAERVDFRPPRTGIVYCTQCQ